MKTIYFINCGKGKRNIPCKAEDMYIAPYFRKQLEYAKLLKPDYIYILSAKYGLLELTDIISPYNLKITTLSKEKRKKWVYRIINKIKSKHNINTDKFIFSCSKEYYKDLLPFLTNTEIINEGLKMGYKAKALTRGIERLKKERG